MYKYESAPSLQTSIICSLQKVGGTGLLNKHAWPKGHLELPGISLSWLRLNHLTSPDAAPNLNGRQPYMYRNWPLPFNSLPSSALLHRGCAAQLLISSKQADRIRDFPVRHSKRSEQRNKQNEGQPCLLLNTSPSTTTCLCTFLSNESVLQETSG